jgi:transcriptional regulator with XRE-family HTH domain
MGQKLNGPLIKAMRKAVGPRQGDLAALAGISDRSVRDAERGKAVGIDVCNRLATALRVDPPDQLFAEKGLRRIRFDSVPIHPSPLKQQRLDQRLKSAGAASPTRGDGMFGDSC